VVIIVDMTNDSGQQAGVINRASIDIPREVLRADPTALGARKESVAYGVIVLTATRVFSKLRSQ